MNEIQTRFENLAAYVSSANATNRDRRAWASALDGNLPGGLSWDGARELGDTQ